MQTIKFGVGVIKNKKDLLSRIERSKVLELESTFTWKKSLDISTEVCNNSILINKKDKKIMSVLKGKCLLGEHNKP